MSNVAPSVYVFCALPCEAKPLIKAWGLSKHKASSPFAIYTRDSHAVIISGLGKIAMASAIGYTLGVFGTPRLPILLNFGIAGHGHHATGSTYIAHKIIDRESGRNFYPSLPFTPPCPSQSLTTCSTAEIRYEQDCLYDMEASAFYETAIKFTSSELAHCLKTISDNRQSPIAHVDESTAMQFCDAATMSLENLIVELRHLRSLLPDMTLPGYQDLLSRFHFSATNDAKLKKLLLRWQALHAEETLEWEQSCCRDGKTFLHWLETQLDSTPFHL